jgi:hypothetical protein
METDSTVLCGNEGYSGNVDLISNPRGREVLRKLHKKAQITQMYLTRFCTAMGSRRWSQRSQRRYSLAGTHPTSWLWEVHIETGTFEPGFHKVAQNHWLAGGGSPHCSHRTQWQTRHLGEKRKELCLNTQWEIGQVCPRLWCWLDCTGGHYLASNAESPTSGGRYIPRKEALLAANPPALEQCGGSTSWMLDDLSIPKASAWQ